jgi:hypothetical protein
MLQHSLRFYRFSDIVNCGDDFSLNVVKEIFRVGVPDTCRDWNPSRIDRLYRVIDPSAASFKAEMSKRGIWHVDADDDVHEGIRITSMVLNQRMVRFCRQTVQKTIQEMQTYAWDSKATLRGEEKPLKTHDHGPDAFRYFAKSEVPYWRLAV